MHVVTPSSVDELAAAMRDAAAGGAVVGIRGGATKQSWAPPGRDADVVIDTSRLDRVLEHAAGDLVVQVQAGVRLADLQQAVGAHRQWLALDPPEQDGTLGGTLATAASGPRRLRFGTPRDLLIGVTVVLADGTVARSGGKVVKNVAGYDLGKLLTGSFGTLGVIAEATLRLHPTFVARRVVTTDTARPWPLVREVLRAPAMPTAIEWYADGAGSGRLHVLLESSEAGVAAQAAQVAALTGGEVADTLPDGLGARPWGPDDLGLKVTHRIGALDDVVEAIRALAPDCRIRAHAGSGVVWVGCGADGALADALRARVASYDGAVVAVHVPPTLRGAVDVWGPARGISVMHRVKEQFDPDHRLNPGRFVGGI